MSKELTPLEALESIIDTFYDKNTDDIKIVRNALKALEIIKKLIIDFSFSYGGKMGNVIKIRIGVDIIRLHFQEGDKNFKIIKEFLYA